MRGEPIDGKHVPFVVWHQALCFTSGASTMSRRLLELVQFRSSCLCRRPASNVAACWACLLQHGRADATPMAPMHKRERPHRRSAFSSG
ncbi:hypothetical protein C8Q76DRAFT_52538 [Earliella scabrosa]|nr:hypothetical protein C8Q76DRAFT_52538 [Earliella scabrosa]